MSNEFINNYDLGDRDKGTLCKGSDNDLRKATFDELLYKFRKCHDLIWEGGKADPASAFDEFSKVLMTKIFDERFTAYNAEYKFQKFPDDTSTSVSQRINKCYEQVKEKNPEIFKSDIKLSNDILFEVVKILQNIAFRSTDLDIKGRAFELFLGSVFRGPYGQYFTPRNAVSFVVSVLDPDEGDTIIDPACGSGGFLLYSLLYVNDKIAQKYHDDKDTLNRIFWEFAHKQIFGIEINDRIARIAMMDMVLHEDGHSNIECNNALANYEEFDKRRDVKPNKYSKLLTNPPFGAIVKDPKILQQYTLGKGRLSQKTEVLFIERSLDLLKPGGKMGIVLPDSILNNSTLQYVRDYILKNSRVIAVVSLPSHAFSPSGAGVKSSLLFLEKRGNTVTANQLIFMAVANNIGFDSRGKEDKNDLNEILQDWTCYIKGKTTLKKSFYIQESQKLTSFSPEQFVNYTKYTSWENKTLDELTDGSIFTGRTPARNTYKTKGKKILKVRDLTGKGIEWDNEERGFVTAEFFEKNKKFIVKQNDILLITAAHHPKYIGQKVDIIDHIPKEFNDCVMTTAELMVIRINPHYLDPYYVLLFLKTKDGYKAIQSCIRGQSAHIYPKDIKNIKVPLPPKNRLKKIQENICALKESLVEKQKTGYTYLQTLRQALAEID